jgi:hypothetical protein
MALLITCLAAAGVLWWLAREIRIDQRAVSWHPYAPCKICDGLCRRAEDRWVHDDGTIDHSARPREFSFDRGSTCVVCFRPVRWISGPIIHVAEWGDTEGEIERALPYPHPATPNAHPRETYSEWSVRHLGW